MKITIPSHLSDLQLEAEVKRLARSEREATVHLVAHLAELDARRLYLGAGFSSLFSYCCEVLQLSEHEAYNRIEVARAARRFPVILDMLAEASLNLTMVRLLAPHLNTDNHRSVLGEAAGRSKREIEALIAHLSPQPDVPATVRKLPGPAPRPQALAEPPDVSVSVAPSPAPQPPVQRPVVAPLAPERYRVQFTVGRETHEKLRLAQELLRREIPDGDPGAIFERALTLLLEEVAKKKLAATSKPRPGRAATPGSRHIPAAVKRTVWLRDRGQCAFVAKSGRRCTERVFLEFHHVEPFALGGETTAANVSLRCRRHNAHEAELVFGRYDPSVVRELPAPYAGSSEQPAAPGTRSERCAGINRHGVAKEEVAH